MHTLEYNSRLTIPHKGDSQNKSQELLNSLKSISDNDIQRIGEEIDLKDGLQKPINNEESEISGGSKKVDTLPKFVKISGKLKDYRKTLRQGIENINSLNKENIIMASNKIQISDYFDLDGNRMIELNIGGIRYKVLDVNLDKYSKDKYVSKRFGSNETVVFLAGIMGNDIEKWENKRLKEYVKEKQGEGFHIPKIEEMKNLLKVLGEMADLNNESDIIALWMYLTGIHGDYWLTMKDLDSRFILRGNERYRHFYNYPVYIYSADVVYGKLFLIANN